MKSMKPVYALFVSASLLLSCSLFGPPKVPSQAESYEPQVTDPVAYKAAQNKLRQANRAYQRHDYNRSLALAKESLALYETFEGHYLKGSVLFQQSKTEEAIRSFKEAERIRPNDPQLLLTMGTAFTAAGDLESALKRYQRLHERNPKEPVYAYKLGTTYKNLRRYEDAYAALKKADQPGFRYLDQTYLQLGDTALELKKYDESRAWFAKARRLNPKLSAASEGTKSTQVAEILEKGNRAFAKKDYETAIGFYDKARELEPKSASPLLLLGSAYLAQKKSAQAKEVLSRALKLAPENPKAYSLLASAHQQAGDYRSALFVLKQGLRVAPESYEMLNKKGLVHRERGELSQAISSYYKALEIRPAYVQARSNLAFALLEARRYGDAKREFRLAAKQAPDNKELQKGAKLVDVYVHLDRGDRFLANRKFRSAAREYALAKKMAPNEPVVYNSLGRLAFARGHTTKAAQNFQKALKLQPNNMAALQGMLRVYSKTRNRRGVKSTLARIRSLTKNDLTAALALGRLKEDEGKLKEAEKYYLRLLKNRPKESLIRRRLGYVYYKQGLKENKREKYKSALSYFQKAQKYNDQIPQLPETIKVIKENIRYKALLPRLKQAERLFSEARYREALPLFESVYKKLKRPLVLVKIANCHIALGREEKGLRLLEDSAGATRAELPIKEAIYTHLLNKHKVGRAQRGFSEIAKNFPDAYFSLYKLGVIDLMQKKYGSAIRRFSEALIHKPGFSVAHIGRGVAFYEKGDKERARLEFEAARKGLHHKEIANFNLGVLYLNDGVLARARGIFTDMLKANPRDRDALYQLSFIYFEEGKLDEAEAALQKALRSSPEPRFYYGLSRIAEKRYLLAKTPENTNRLRSLYKEIVVRYPNTRYAEEARAKLRRISPDSRLVQPYPRLPRADSKPMLVNSRLLYFSKNSLVCVSSQNKRVQFQTRLPARPRSLLVDHLAFVLAGKEIFILDLANGRILSRFAPAAGAVALTGNARHLGVVYGGRRPYLAVYSPRGRLLAKTRPLARSRYFYFQGRFYSLLPTGRELALSRLAFSETARTETSETIEDAPKKDGQSAPGSGKNTNKITDGIANKIKSKITIEKNLQLPFGRRNARPRLLLGKEKIVLYLPGGRLFSVSKDLELMEKIRLPGTALQVLLAQDGRIAVPSATKIAFFKDGKKAKVLRLPVPLASQSALQLQEKHILFVGRDQKIHRITYEGKSVWKKPLSLQKSARALRYGAAWSVYY